MKRKRTEPHPINSCPRPSIKNEAVGDLYTCGCGQVLARGISGWGRARWRLAFLAPLKTWSLFVGDDYDAMHKRSGTETLRSPHSAVDEAIEWAKFSLARLGLEVIGLKPTDDSPDADVWLVTQPERFGARALARAEVLNNLPELA